MTKQIIGIVLSAFIFVQFSLNEASAQKKSCGTDIYHQQLLNSSPVYKQNQLTIEKHNQSYVNSNNRSKLPVKTIPVVVHIIYGNAAQNLSTAQIQSQIDVLNEDFRKLNADTSIVPSAFKSLVADAQIQFCLAKRDPSGNPTNGITRTSTGVPSFFVGDSMKFNSLGGKDAWPRSDYLNIWVCNLGGLLGYATFPGGTANVDGVVCHYLSFGRPPHNTANWQYNLGRTATHEVGHWLNLRHVWGTTGSSCADSDLVSDTPNQDKANYGCPSYPSISCSNGPNGDMFMNYMDYVDDACMVMFSIGQATRMNAVLDPGGARNSLLSSLGCTAVCANYPTVSVSVTPITCNGDNNGSLTASASGATPPYTYLWSNGFTTATITNLSPGCYTVTVSDVGGCPDTVTVCITDPPTINAVIFTNDPITFCQGSSALLQVQSFDPNHMYQWLKSGIPISGATASTYNAKQNGNHRLSIVDTNGCSANSNIILITKNSRPPASLVVNGAIPICVGDSVQLTANIGNYTYQWIRNSKLQSGATSTTFYAKSAGNHKVLVTDANGCFRTSNKISVTRYPRVQANVNPSGTVVICPPDSIQLSAVVTVGTSPYSYQWYRYNTSQSGETSVDYYADKFGGYKVIVTDNHGCTDKTSSTVVQEVCRLANGDTYTLNDNLQVSAYPNPFNNNVTIALDNFSEDRIKIIVRDMIGRVVYQSEENPEFEYQLNTSEYASGIYLIELRQDDYNQSVKLTKY